MGKPRKQHRKQKFDYDRNRRKEWKKSKQMPNIECQQIKNAWDKKKSVRSNLHDMGISADPNQTLTIPRTKDLLTSPKSEEERSDCVAVRNKKHVVEELEAEASLPTRKTLRLSEQEVRYCIYMMEKYGDDHKAMARDRRNYYQDTPKQIKWKIKVFQSIPEQYNEYLTSKESTETAPESTRHSVVPRPAPETAIPVTPPQHLLPFTHNLVPRKATRKYRAKRRNGHYLTPSIGETPLSRPRPTDVRGQVQFHKVRRKLQFGRKPPTQRQESSILDNSRKINQPIPSCTQQKIPTSDHTLLYSTCSHTDTAKCTSSSSKLSRELLQLQNEITSNVLPCRLRSSGKCSRNETVHQQSNTLHTSPERSKRRQN